MPDRDTVALSTARAWRVPRWLRATDWLHRPEPIEPPGPDNPDDPDEDDVPPDPDRLPGEPLPLPIGDPPPNYAPQSARRLAGRSSSRAPPFPVH
jgi:hypothetical protein